MHPFPLYANAPGMAGASDQPLRALVTAAALYRNDFAAYRMHASKTRCRDRHDKDLMNRVKRAESRHEALHILGQFGLETCDLARARMLKCQQSRVQRLPSK
jgi:hypothetical protein